MRARLPSCGLNRRPVRTFEFQWVRGAVPAGARTSRRPVGLSAPAAAPDTGLLTLTGLAALAVNLTAAFILAGARREGGSLTRAAFLSARNDALANLAIIGAGLVTAFLWRSAWPDLIVGLAIAALNADAAREVWEAAREEHAAEA